MNAFLSYLVLALAVSAATAALTSSKKDKVQSAFEKYKIVPDVIDVAPTHMCESVYPSGAVPNLGNELKPSQTRVVPRIDPLKQTYMDSKSYYTVIYIDADACEDADLQYLVRLEINIPGPKIGTGDILAEYVGPDPQKGSGIHRYIGLIYKQPDMIDADEVRSECAAIIDRDTFNIKEFVEKYCLGNPVSGNFFRAKYEKCVA